MTDHMDQHVRTAPQRYLRGAANAFRFAMRAIKTIKLLLVILKAIAAIMLSGGWVLALIGLFLVIVYAIMLSPATAGRELAAARDRGEYAGEILSHYLDVDDRWDEEADLAAQQEYEKYKDKCLEGLDEFQRAQAFLHALPHALLMAIERVELFSSPSADEWFPNPGPLHERLGTRYEWIDSTVVYRASYMYNYDYIYNWDEHIPAQFDRRGNLISPARVITHTVENAAGGTADLEFPFAVKLLKSADAFDNIYHYEYADYVTDEDIVTGTKNLTHQGIINDSIETKHDGHEDVLLETNLKDAIHADARARMMAGIHPQAYNLRYNLAYEIISATKRHRPVDSVITEGVRFARLESFLRDHFGREIDPLDLAMIFHITTEYSEDFAYNFAANHGFTHFIPPVHHTGLFDGGLIWPVPGTPGVDHYITSPFGPRRGLFHGGVDIGAHRRHVPILAAADGKVVFAGRAAGYGNTVIIDHGLQDGRRVTTLYAHLHRITARHNREIEKGDKLGLMGNTGRSFGIHLHFEIIIDNRKLDPLKFYPTSAYR